MNVFSKALLVCLGILLAAGRGEHRALNSLSAGPYEADMYVSWKANKPTPGTNLDSCGFLQNPTESHIKRRREPRNCTSEKGMALQKQHTLHTIVGKEQWVLIFGGCVLALISQVRDSGQIECVSQGRNATYGL